jgi:hypothetical protein
MNADKDHSIFIGGSVIFLVKDRGMAFILTLLACLC